jgi:hypothetical protein
MGGWVGVSSVIVVASVPMVGVGPTGSASVGVGIGAAGVSVAAGVADG